MRYLPYDGSKFLLWVYYRLGFGLEVRGQEHVPKTGKFILASNHVSYFDPPVLGAACPRRLVFMARETLFKSGLLGAYMRSVRVIPLRHDEGDRGAIRAAVSRLQGGEAVAIFPEGGRQFSGRLGQAKRGVGLLATAAQAPIVPVLVQGTFQALPPNQRRIHRAKIRVAFGPQISYTDDRFPGTPSAAARTGRSQQHQTPADRVTQSWHHLEDELTRE